MTIQDEVIGALTAWKENRGGGIEGMQSVLNTLQNRAKERGTSIYAEAVRKWQYSSMTAPGDPELGLYPAENDAQWIQALALAQEAANGTLVDITGGSTFYYADTLKDVPEFFSKLTPTVIIAGQKFFKQENST